jgi:phosphotransferase system HPr (HPr) family protein
MSTVSATRTVVITNPAGLHARPSAAIAQIVRRSKSEVLVQRGRDTVNAANILELMMLGAPQGTQLTLTASGPDAENVLDAIAAELAKHYDS